MGTFNISSAYAERNGVVFVPIARVRKQKPTTMPRYPTIGRIHIVVKG